MEPFSLNSVTFAMQFNGKRPDPNIKSYSKTLANPHYAFQPAVDIVTEKHPEVQTQLTGIMNTPMTDLC